MICKCDKHSSFYTIGDSVEHQELLDENKTKDGMKISHLHASEKYSTF